MHGARLAANGKAVISLPSTAQGGKTSRIVPNLSAGAGVVTTRGHVQFVATEYGVVNLAGQSIRKRAELLTSIAHPDMRADLINAARHRFHSMPGKA